MRGWSLTKLLGRRGRQRSRLFEARTLCALNFSRGRQCLVEAVLGQGGRALVAVAERPFGRVAALEGEFPASHGGAPKLEQRLGRVPRVGDDGAVDALGCRLMSLFSRHSPRIGAYRCRQKRALRVTAPAASRNLRRFPFHLQVGPGSPLRPFLTVLQQSANSIQRLGRPHSSTTMSRFPEIARWAVSISSPVRFFIINSPRALLCREARRALLPSRE